MHLNGMVFNQAQGELVPSLLKYGTIKIIKKNNNNNNNNKVILINIPLHSSYAGICNQMSGTLHLQIKLLITIYDMCSF